MPDLAVFQQAAVERIVERLTDSTGSRRFLLADEVGLGKTLVAQGVVRELRARKAGQGFTVVYICSNTEIAAQNRANLLPDGAGTEQCPAESLARLMPLERLTLLPLRSCETDQNRARHCVQLFSFTPGTSLKIGQLTGVEKERRLLLYLLLRTWGKRVRGPEWREFFRCSSGCGWDERSRFRYIRKEYLRKVSGEFQARLREEWNSRSVRLLDGDTGKELPRPVSLRSCIDGCVAAYKRDDKVACRNRNRIIGALRHGLARVALDYLEPDLIILDEFQRFDDILDESRDPESVVGRLFTRRGRRGAAVLILSATPYRMYTQAFEGQSHHEKFIGTLAFLHDCAPGDAHVSDIKAALEQFKDRLDQRVWLKEHDRELSQLKSRIEESLKTVMCRTERNWYMEDSSMGVRELPDRIDSGVTPDRRELGDYIGLRRLLLGKGIDDWNVTDFWKSSPSVFSFMDSQYALMRRLRRKCAMVPKALLAADVPRERVWRRNLKFRMLFELLFEQQKSDCKERRHVAGWRFLWARPTYMYYRDTFYRDDTPSKFLVFSHWRFVPKAVSVLTSQAVVADLGLSGRQRESAPLRFRPKIAFYPFDVCYPSPVLAECIDPLRLALSCPQPARERDLFRKAECKIKELLRGAGIEIGETCNAPIWRIVARLESRSDHHFAIADALKACRVAGPHGYSEHFPHYVRQYLDWMDDGDSALRISPSAVKRLTAIALYSPAVCLLRSLDSVLHRGESLTGEMTLCLNHVRTYFNKPMVRAIIHRHRGKARAYTAQVLAYCRDAHFQAMMDEYCYLLVEVLQRRSRSKCMDHLGRALGLWQGAPVTNQRTSSGRVTRGRAMQTHFALSFGDEVTTDSMDADGRTRKSAVRDAFNSPFWPFVLATTSIGQEGLDLHLYCRDVVHWNLPSNPVDLEQREGRVNRRDSLAVRQNIAMDYRLSDISFPGGNRINLWKEVFHTLAGSTGQLRLPATHERIVPAARWFGGTCSSMTAVVMQAVTTTSRRPSPSTA
jgi:hypothetical protein